VGNATNCSKKKEAWGVVLLLQVVALGSVQARKVSKKPSPILEDHRGGIYRTANSLKFYHDSKDSFGGTKQNAEPRKEAAGWVLRVFHSRTQKQHRNN
jgi:hypothetical protein